MIVLVMGLEAKSNKEDANGDIISYIRMVEKKVDGLERQVASMEGRMEEEIKHGSKKGEKILTNHKLLLYLNMKYISMQFKLFAGVTHF